MNKYILGLLVSVGMLSVAANADILPDPSVRFDAITKISLHQIAGGPSASAIVRYVVEINGVHSDGSGPTYQISASYDRSLEGNLGCYEKAQSAMKYGKSFTIQGKLAVDRSASAVYNPNNYVFSFISNCY